nr:putative integron gene cassette protein [uncultured bacterium]
MNGIHFRDVRGEDREEPTMNQDADHLRLLSIYHYVVGGLAALFSFVPIFHLVIGFLMVTGRPEGSDAFARAFGWAFVFFSGALMLCGWAFSAAAFLAGRALANRTRYLYCLVVAGIECIFMPFRTVLGVFTIIVLMRESVKRLFGVETAHPEPPQA